MLRIKSVGVLIPVLLGVLSCSIPDNDNATSVIGGTSFGECGGYCITILTITEDVASYTRSSWFPTDYPDITEIDYLSDSVWNNLIDAIDIGAFARLDTIIGCPDCADGGSEWIEIIQPDFRKKITFEYGDTLTTIQELVQQVRNIRKQFLP